MKLIITEKPSAANDIAKAIGIQNKEKTHILCGEYKVTWAFGHLFKLDDSMYQGTWELAPLPLLPESFGYTEIEDKKHQIRAIHALIKDAEEIIVATDAGREGELIAREILETYKGKLPRLTRFWSSEALTEEVVKKQIEKRKPLSEYDSLYYAAKTRQESDWVVGINLTRLFSVKARSQWTVGRVQTPCLGLICRRQKEIEDFIPQPFSTIEVEMEKEKDRFMAKAINLEKEREKDRFSADEAEKIRNFLEKIDKAKVENLNRENKKKLPPNLYSLTTLQRAANRKYGMSAQRTLDTAQRLYEKYKCISYPRTDSQYLGESNIDLAKEVLGRFRADLVGKVDTVGKRVFDSSKLTDHHALIPLKEYTGSDSEEYDIYMLIRNSFIACFYPAHEYEETVVIFDVEKNPVKLVATGKTIIENGWKDIYKTKGENEGEDEEKEIILPELNIGEWVSIIKAGVKNQMTTPPKPHSEESLLGMMDKLGLGTPATRAAIIEKLANMNYIVKDKRNLFPSTKGTELIGLLEGSSVKEPEMTAQWETDLERIYRDKKGENGYREFMEGIRQFTTKEVNKYKDSEITVTREATSKMIEMATKLATENKVKDFDKKNKDYEYIHTFIDKELQKSKEGVDCPCGKGKVKQTPKAYSCEGCSRIIWKEVSGKTLTLDQALKLLDGKELSLKGFKNKEGKKFDAILYIDSEKKLKFKFESHGK